MRAKEIDKYVLNIEGKQKELVEKHVEDQKKKREAARAINRKLSKLTNAGAGMLRLVEGERVGKREVRLQEILQARLQKAAKNMLDEVKEEEETVQAIKTDVGYDIFNESILLDRQPVEFCMSMCGGSNIKNGLMEGNINIKDLKEKK